MGGRWSTEQVLALAPDAASSAAARKLAGPGPWRDTGAAGTLVWGYCAGSGKTPYQAAVDLDGPAYRCSCPSRKFPCKHALGLLLLWSADGVPDAAEPAQFASEWKSGRVQRAERAASTAAGERDEAAAAKRSQQRAERVAAGLAELDLWLRDQVQAGITAAAGGYGHVEPVAARMVDAQAPGVAGSVRALGGIAGTGEGWPARLLAGYARLHLLVRAHQRLDDLPPELASTVRAHVGYPTAKESVLASTAIDDRWLVLARTDVLDVAVPTRRTWLRGRATGRDALLLAFDPRGSFGADPDATLAPGTQLEAGAHFYPGAPALRALLGARRGEPTAAAPPTAESVAMLLDRWAGAIEHDPWLTAWPAVLHGIPVSTGDGWLLAESAEVAVPLAVAGPWLLHAVAGGRPRAGGGGVGRPLVPSADGMGRRNGGVADVNYDELVAAATVGVGARPVVPDALPAPADGLAHVLSADPSVAVLDAAALLDAARRAGGFTPRTAELPVAAADETGPAVPASAVRLLLDVLAHDRLLAAELIGDLAGRHVPARFLPALLTAAARDTALREPIAGVLGERGRWLAAQHPEWRRVLAAGSDIASEVDAADESTWTTGRPDQRRAWLLARRALDPDAARTVLEAGWTKESGDDRTTLLRALRPQLARADEPLLERALDDRKASVRAVAGQLLGVLPGSAYQQRAVARGGAALRVERKGLRRQLVATPPPEPDAATLRDGVTPRSGDRTLGDGAWRLIQVVASVPLSAWPELLGANPTGLADLRAQQWLREVHVGWRLRAVAEGNAEWARALLRHPLDPPGEPGDVALARLVPAAERVGPLLADIRAGRRDADGDLVPTPWPAELTEAVLGYVGKQLNAADPGPPPAIISSLGRHAAVDAVSADGLPRTLRELADRARARARTEQHYQAQSWGQALDTAAESLDLRRRIRRALESA